MVDPELCGPRIYYERVLYRNSIIKGSSFGILPRGSCYVPAEGSWGTGTRGV